MPGCETFFPIHPGGVGPQPSWEVSVGWHKQTFISADSQKGKKVPGGQEGVLLKKSPGRRASAWQSRSTWRRGQHGGNPNFFLVSMPVGANVVTRVSTGVYVMCCMRLGKQACLCASTGLCVVSVGLDVEVGERVWRRGYGCSCLRGAFFQTVPQTQSSVYGAPVELENAMKGLEQHLRRMDGLQQRCCPA